MSVKLSRLFVALMIALLLGACSQKETELRVVVGGLETNLEITRSLAAHLDADPRFRVVEVAPQDDGAVAMLSRGEADLALVENTSRYQSGIASVLPIYAGVLHISFREGVDPRINPEYLVGKTVFAGARDSLSYALIRGFLASVGLDDSAVTVTTQTHRGSCPMRLPPSARLHAGASRSWTDTASTAWARPLRSAADRLPTAFARPSPRCVPM